jgi:hypothetical protein
MNEVNMNNDDTTPPIKVGDTVRTENMMFFVDATHPQTGEEIEVQFPRWHRLKVIGVNLAENTIDVALPKGFVATLDIGDVELPL